VSCPVVYKPLVAVVSTKRRLVLPVPHESSGFFANKQHVVLAWHIILKPLKDIDSHNRLQHLRSDK
jgi:hypothetical protein